jgi:hypothetical protein
MVPDEKPKTAPEQSASPSAKGPQRRSRRGGRRHPRRRDPNPAESQPTQPVRVSGPEAGPVEHAESAGQDFEDVEAAQPLAPREQVERRPIQPQPRPVPGPQPEREHAPKIPAVTQAIEQVNEIIEELKRALNEMEDVLETLELAERQKIDDEREIEELKRALRRLHRPRDDAQRHP